MNKDNKKRGINNLRINTRIVLTSVVAALIPLIIIGSSIPAVVDIIPRYLEFSTVTTNTYNLFNQLQWDQVITKIANEMASENSETKKYSNISEYVTPLESIHSLIYIEENGEAFYETISDKDVLDRARAITATDLSKNLNYFSDGALVIIDYEVYGNNKCMIAIVNEDYTINNTSERLNIRDFTNLLLSRTGMAIVIIAMLFVLAIIVLSFITSKTIVNPIKKIAVGAEEIARGNLDYEIDFDSTNELGQTVNSFNNMRIRLKESIERQKNADEKRKILVAGIAHDLRTPLTSAKGYTEGLIDGIAKTPEKQQKYLRIIHKSICDTEKILDELMTASRLDLEDFELNRVNVSAKEFFIDGTADIKKWVTKKGFDFVCNINCSDEVVISIDIDRFIRVINNVISNSIRYAREDIKGVIKMSLDEYEHTVILEITDNGIGVDKKSLPRIFDKMYRADPARTKVSDGSGLGLAICKQIVELHGGSIWATSREGEGLSIFISMPKEIGDK